MQFLSVAWRELRVAARKPSCFRVRMFTSCIALLVAGFALWFVTFTGTIPMAGEQLFYTLSCVTFICACLAGPALTADCVNEERNNGTLGFLFLTNLPPISISLGKLAGHGTLALYSIISIVPVMALPVILGGADAEALAKTALVLCVTLSLSLTTGMLASTLCRKTWTAAALTLFALAFLVLGVPLAVRVLRLYQRVDWTWIEVLSPNYSLSMALPSASTLPSNHLWLALGAQSFIALTFFGLTTFLLPRVWQEGKSSPKASYVYTAWSAFLHGSGPPQNKLRTRLLQINPILWLSSRERFGPMFPALAVLAPALAICWIGGHVRVGFYASAFLNPMRIWIAGMPLLYGAFCLRLTAAASGRFSVDRKSGALELILCTPLSVREIIRGHWLGLIRRYWGAALALLGIHAFILNYILEAIRLEQGLGFFNLPDVFISATRHLFVRATIPNDIAFFYVASLAVSMAAVLMVILWIALGWLGMALSLKLRREILAPWVSVLLLAVPPIPIFISIVPLIANKDLFASNRFLSMFTFGATGFSVVLTNATIWLLLARRWTYRKLRATATSPFSSDGNDLPAIRKSRKAVQ